jgi:hypothetical protein
MAVTASIILDTRYKSNKGFPIKIRVRPKYIHLQEFSGVDDWDGSNVKKSHPEYRRLHLKLQRRQLQLLDEVQYCNDHDLDFESAFKVIKNGLKDTDAEIFALKQKIKTLQNLSGVGFLEFFDVRIKEKSVIGESVSHYELTKARLVNYLGAGNDINLNLVTYEWLVRFRDYKLANGADWGGVNSYMETMRAVFNEAQRRTSLNIKPGNPFNGVIKGGKKRDIVELEKTDFKKLLNYAPERAPTKMAAKKQIRNVWVWLFQVCIGGHDYIDVALLKWTDIKNGRIRFKRYKNRRLVDGGAPVDNELLKLSVWVIDRYGTKDNVRVFGFIPDPIKENRRYVDYRRNVNRSLRTVSNNLDLSDRIKTKSPRYLFKTKAGEMLVHDLVVKQLQGRKFTGENYNYQAKLPYKVLDKQHKMIVKGLLGKVTNRLF